MNFKYSNIIVISVLFGFIMAIILMNSCEKPRKNRVIIRETIREVNVPDTLIVYEKIKVIEKVPIYNIDTISVGKIIGGDTIRDTTFIKHFASLYNQDFKFEDDSVKINGVASIIADSLYKFRLENLTLQYKYVEKTILKENKRLILVAGFDTGINDNSLYNLTPKIGLRFRKIEVNYGVQLNISTGDIIQQIGVMLPLNINK